MRAGPETEMVFAVSRFYCTFKIGFRSRQACWNIARDRIKIKIKRQKCCSIKSQLIRQRKTTGLPLRNGTKVAPGKATVFEAFRSREVLKSVSISHLPGPAICRGSLSIHEIDLWRRNIRKIQAQTQSQFRVRERLPIISALASCN